MLTARPSLLAALTSAAAASAAFAGLSHTQVVAPGGFVQSLAGPSTPGAGPWPGSDLSTMYTAPGSDIQETLFAGDTTATRIASYSGGSTSNSASGTVGMGFMHLLADNDAPNSSFFAEANANGGWKDSFLITAPGQNGQTGYMQFTLNVTGFLSAAGFAGAASFTTTAYKDTTQLLANALFSPGNSDPLSSDRQYGHWSVSSAPNNSKNVSGVITMAVPFTYGTPFNLGIYANAEAGMRSSSGVSGNSQASVQFQNSLYWGGISGMYLGGTTNTISDYQIVSGSGIDWRGAIPSPATAMLLAAHALVAARRRR
ncbi:MAG: hypothetical protein DYG92_04400 [Leptolyngbya sp. PLA1]|nr:hypothetical protein [Leptolyngbya sp. PLA1]